jgi:hypothetical protein
VTTLVLVASLVLLSLPATAAAAPGDHRWADTVFHTGVFDDESAVAMEMADEYPVIVGNAATPAGDFDIRYRSYFLDGILRWNTSPETWGGAAGGDDTAAGVVADDARNAVYVAGTTESAGGDDDIVLLRVSNFGGGGLAPGELVWAATFDAKPGKGDEAAAVARDKYGNVYVTGRSQRADDSWDIITLKYDQNGTRIWAKRHNNGAARFDRGFVLAVRGSYLYVAGVSRRTGHADDIVLIKYSLGGARKWVRYYDDKFHRSEVVGGIALTSSSIYLCGSGKFTATKPGDALLMKYSAGGSRRWVKYVAGSAGGDDAWTDVAVDSKARVHVTGFCDRKGSAEDIVTRLYAYNGKKLWQRIYKTGGMDVATALTVDEYRRTYVCGFRTGSAGSDLVAIKYSAAGATQWHTRYPWPAKYPGEADLGDDWAVDIAVPGPSTGSAAQANVYIAGTKAVDHSPAGGVDRDFLTMAVWR